MGLFLNSEKERQAALKAEVTLFSESVGLEQTSETLGSSFFLPVDHATENLFEGIRASVLDYFAEKEIVWHGGVGGGPSNHLCDSQVSCLNFLFPFASSAETLRELLLPVYPDIRQMLPMELHGSAEQFVAFEWIGERNYLGERIARGEKRTRGANCTSADAAVLFEQPDGKRQLVLIEWKYTESYPSRAIRFSARGTDRAVIYRRFYEAADCPIDRSLVAHFDDLFYEPFYQLMRQQFLAREMERARELGADIVSVLHVSPTANRDLQTVTSPELRPLGSTAIDVWIRLTKDSDRFRSISTEKLFGALPMERLIDLFLWRGYLVERYGPLLNNGEESDLSGVPEWTTEGDEATGSPIAASDRITTKARGRVTPMPRGLDNEFISDLQTGRLRTLLEAVKVDRDLLLEIRENYLNIYFKGHSLLKLTKTGGRYAISQAEKFQVEAIAGLSSLVSEIDTDRFVAAIPEIKERIIRHRQGGNEIEYEQMLIRSNNGERRLNTEYYIIDRQVSAVSTEGQPLRFDLVGIYWPSKGRQGNRTVSLALIEVKFSQNKDIAELPLQLGAYYRSLPDDLGDVADEARTLLHHKLDLGLIQGTPEQLAALRTLKIKPRKSDMRFGVVLVDYNPNSRLLDADALGKLGFPVDVFNVGFGLWQGNAIGCGVARPPFS